MKWLLLGIAIVFEVIATTALKYCDNFKKLIPSIIVVVGYGVSFYVFSYAIKYLPLGGVLRGVGAVWGWFLISLIGFILFKQIVRPARSDRHSDDRGRDHRAQRVLQDGALINASF